MTEIKFCGMTRAADARAAAELGATYVGVVFAGGPRAQTDERAVEIFAALPTGVKRVGVFGADAMSAIVRRASALALDVVQLHADPAAHDVAELRALWPGGIWAALRVEGLELPAHAAELFATADAVLLDAKVPGVLGGRGVALDWSALADGVAVVRKGGGRLVLAGGLRPENVADAIRSLNPDDVDVSSGVEASVGIKDAARMRAFRDAVRSVEVAR